MSKDRELLEDLKALSGCTYISDLRSVWRRPLLKKVLREIEPERYPVGQWQELVHYLCDEPCSAAAAEGCWQYLQRWLEEGEGPA